MCLSSRVLYKHLNFKNDLEQTFKDWRKESVKTCTNLEPNADKGCETGVTGEVKKPQVYTDLTSFCNFVPVSAWFLPACIYYLITSHVNITGLWLMASTEENTRTINCININYWI